MLPILLLFRFVLFVVFCFYSLRLISIIFSYFITFWNFNFVLKSFLMKTLFATFYYCFRSVVNNLCIFVCVCLVRTMCFVCGWNENITKSINNNNNQIAYTLIGSWWAKFVMTNEKQINEHNIECLVTF